MYNTCFIQVVMNLSESFLKKELYFWVEPLTIHRKQIVFSSALADTDYNNNILKVMNLMKNYHKTETIKSKN